jgi:hypothetical protein
VPRVGGRAELFVAEYRGLRDPGRVRELTQGDGWQVGLGAGHCPHTAPNQALHLTVYSVRSCVAPASGSR